MPKTKLKKPRKLTASELVRLHFTPWPESPGLPPYNPSDKKSFEGRGERIRRHILGLLMSPVQGPIDIPEFGEEVKDIEYFNPKTQKIEYRGKIRMGHSTQNCCFGRAHTLVARLGYWPEIDEVLKKFEQLRVSRKDLKKLPDYVDEVILNRWKPSNFFSEKLNRICLVTSYGYFLIERKDFDEAFVFSSVSQARFNFNFNWDFLRKLSRPSSATCDTMVT